MLEGLIVSVVLIIVGLGAVGYYFTCKSYQPKCWESKACYESEVERGMIDPQTFEALPQEKVQIESDYNCTLQGIYFPNGTSQKTMVIIHGYTYAKYGSVKYMQMFYKQGYNVLIYDHRGHGDSGPSLCSMGHIEQYDLIKWLDWIEARNGKGHTIGTLGVSMGGAIVLMHGAIDKRVSFIVADCPYASLWEQFRYILKRDYHLPAFPVLYVSSLVSKFRIGATIKEIEPIKGVNEIEAPILWIHGAEDNFVPTEASKQMYEKRTGKKQLYLVEKAGHADAYQVNSKKYEEVVKSFLEEMKINEG